MSTPLVPCSGCQRHVRAGSVACPFCGVKVEGGAARVVPSAPVGKRLTRAAMFTFGAALAVAACGGSSTTEGATDAGAAGDGAKSDAATDDGGVQALYGLPPPDAAADTGYDAGNVQPPYGLPPMDAGDGG